MSTSFLLPERTDSFRMRRPTLTNGSFVTDVDQDVRKRLDELEQLLGKAIIPTPGSGSREDRSKAESGGEDTFSPDDDGTSLGAASDAASGKGSAGRKGGTPRRRAVEALLRLPLLAWRPESAGAGGGWPNGSLAQTLKEAGVSDQHLTLAEHIDLTPDLAQLKYDLKARLDGGWFPLDPNARTVLQGRPNIQDYLVAKAYHMGGLRDPKALFNHLIGNRAGVKSVVDYAVISAARTLIHRKRLQVTDFDKDDSKFVDKLREKPISLADAAFDKSVDAVIKDVMFNSDASKLLEGAKIGPIPEELKPRLIAYIKTSKIPITRDNIDLFLPSFISRALDYEGDEPVDEEFAEIEEDRSYKVQFRDHSDTEIDIDREAVRYAAQLFHAMVLGEELGVFDAFGYLLHSRMLLGGGMEVRDKKLRADLRLYTLSNQYRDLGRPGQPAEDRTRASERQMFTRQVFAQGPGQLIEGMQENLEFRQLWQVLMLESARFLERAQESFNPGSFVSKQNVMQAVEDLQYNLSTHCVGWPQVMAPAIDAELNFVLTRFVENQQIAQQVIPAGGSWKRVIDKLNAERPKKGPIAAASLLYAKATQGMAIIEAIAEYTPAAFEDDRAFSSFIGLVDAYITTESKLQGRRTAAARTERPRSEEEEEEEAEQERGVAEQDEAEPVGDDEWDF